MATMSRREVVLGLLASGRAPERVPAAFFMHFDAAHQRGRAAVDRHLAFLRATDMDLVKIQYEQIGRASCRERV